ncbi:MAG: BON domain-containing protein [Vicinamibacterales bacterium]
MFRFLFRLIVLLIVAGAIGAYMLGWRPAGVSATAERPIDKIDTATVKEVGAELGAKASEAASVAQTAIADGSITAKIKAKLALDDTVKSRDINVDYSNGVVTLRGTVGSAAERKRALDLARETKGVRSVDDKLTLIR